MLLILTLRTIDTEERKSRSEYIQRDPLASAGNVSLDEGITFNQC
jgi:hypothetical protein